MNELVLFFIIVITIFIIINYYKKSKLVEYKVSKIDNIKYLVRKLPDSDKAADKLALINKKIFKLIDYLKDDPKIENLKRYKKNKLSETIPGSEYKSYSVNKGESIAMCIREEGTNKFMDDNIIIFVLLHELAHVITKSSGHTDEFWNNMRYLIEKSEEINLYNPIDYKKNPEMYCGMEINSTPYIFK